jgi:hypothetical protein
MPRRRRDEEILGRRIRIDAVTTSVSMQWDEQRGLPPRLESRPSLRFKGYADPIGDVSEYRVSLFVDDRERQATKVPPAIGAIIGIRPVIQPVIHVPSSTFSYVWGLAVSGQLRHCHLAFTKPKWRRALIVSASFANEDDEADDHWGNQENPTGPDEKNLER